MRINNKLLIRSLLVTALVALGIVLFISNFEQVEEQVEIKPGKEARLNPFLAAQRFLEQNGLEVESIRGHRFFTDTPTPADTVIMDNRNPIGDMPESQQQHINDWISAGGHMVLVIQTLWDEESQSSGDPFLDSFGIRQYLHDLEEPAEIPATEVQINERGDRFAIRFLPEYYMVDGSGQAISRFEDDYGAHLLQYSVGDGILTVVTDNELWRNHGIGDHDHALFLRSLIAPQMPDGFISPGKVWLALDVDQPSLTDLIWQYAPETVIAAALLLLCALWAAYNRFGPPVVEQRRSRRSLLEHLDACGHHHWHYNRGEKLLQSIREQIHLRAEQLHPTWPGLTLEQRLDWLQRRHQHGSLNSTQLKSSLFDTPEDEKQYIETVQTLQQLRKNL